MNKTALKIFVLFSVTAGVIATILMVINFFSVALVGSDVSTVSSGQRALLAEISDSLEAGSREVLLPEGYWCMLIDESGNVVWDQDKPDDVPDTYTINDIARMSRWFLNDYPVYTRTEDYGLLVLAKPKNAVGKYQMEYSMSWFDSLPQRLVYVLLFNLLLATVLACIFGTSLYRRIRELTRGLSDLRAEKPVKLRERGIFRDIYRNINITSAAIERKNKALSIRESARRNWIAGISHDIRTPLSVITGYAEALSENKELSENNKHRAEVIVSNSMKIKKLIEDLNLISSMEYDMQPSKRQPVKICPLIRRVSAEILNNKMSDRFSVALDLKAEGAAVMGDEGLLERAVYNVINNAVTHNKDGCTIQIKEYEKGGNIVIEIRDNGTGVPDSVLENIDKIPKTTHGIGLPMAYRIVSVHGGRFESYNDNGFCIMMTFPRE
jgi:signal transduction histidine kinase